MHEHLDQDVEVSVEYGLAEYKRVLQDFIPVYLKKQGKTPNRLLPWNWPVVEAAAFSLFVPPMFWLKKALIGTCTFAFTSDGLSRASKGRTGSRRWDEVAAVHRVSEAYLIELKAGGAMPVPYRVFTADQKQRFELLSQRVAHDVAATR